MHANRRRRRHRSVLVKARREGYVRPKRKLRVIAISRKPLDFISSRLYLRNVFGEGMNGYSLKTNYMGTHGRHKSHDDLR